MQVCIHTCGSQRWTLVSYQFLSILFILIAHYDDDDDDEGVCVCMSVGGIHVPWCVCGGQRTTSTEPVLSFHFYMGSRY